MKNNRVWRHNGYSGQCTWAIKALQGMMGGDTLTDEARQQASKIIYELHVLLKLLKHRKPEASLIQRKSTND